MLAIFLGLAAPAGAASDDHDRARDAVRAGHIQPLNSILARVQSQFHGRVVGVRLVKPGPNPRQWRYRVPAGDDAVCVAVLRAAAIGLGDGAGYDVFLV